MYLYWTWASTAAPMARARRKVDVAEKCIFGEVLKGVLTWIVVQ
jgi:hypothetical protein